MPDSTIANVKKKIGERHFGDLKQLEVVFSASPRILVEAPAGYGKTNTMVSRIAYMLATGQIPYPKRLLALTFSVNAAYKIKRDVIEQVPELLSGTGLSVNVNNKVFISNYHGFCRNVLKKYGYLLSESLFSIDKLQSVDDSNPQRIMSSYKQLDLTAANLLADFDRALKKTDAKSLAALLDSYNRTIITNLLPNESISYNSILTLTIKLFQDYPKILEFYQRYYRVILVDEYQDTNTLSYWLIKLLIADKSKVMLLGDSLQRIYGFIGAIPNLLSKSQSEFDLARITLDTNHRFASNQQMLQLDSNIRRNAENPYRPAIAKEVIVDLTVAADQQAESSRIADKCVSLIKSNAGARLAILVKQRGSNVNSIIESFGDLGIPYFFCLFTDEEAGYIQFHRRCRAVFGDLIKLNNRITKALCASHIKKVLQKYPRGINPMDDSLLSLLEIFWERIFVDYQYLSNDEKLFLIIDTFEYNGLKQYIEYAKSDIIISTVHAAKGLEWDFVILPDMEQDSFPNYYGLCGSCGCRPNCQLIVTDRNERQFLEELSVFYVAVTRAKKQVYFSCSGTQLDSSNNPRSKEISCFLRLPGIKYQIC
jgi:DNA helicase-2/ATP-dependent DNA helicase PcrA